MLDFGTLAVLAGAGVVAGFVDAVAGGGGLIAIPMLMGAGLSPLAAIATNKVQSVFGTAIAAATFWRRGFVQPLRTLAPTLVLTFAGSAVGAAMVGLIDVSALEAAVPLAVIAVALYFIFSPSLRDIDRVARLDFSRFAPLVGFVIGAYDGLFGPGTGSFLMLAFMGLFGFGLLAATGHAKILNLVSNLAALAVFVPAGDVVWSAGLAMAAGQLLGGYLGARTGIRHGARIIRPLVVLVSIALAIRLLFWGA